MILTRSPLEPIGMSGMNGASAPQRRSARLSGESVEENEPPAKKNRVEAQTSTVSTKDVDGDSNAASKKKRKGMLSFAPRARMLACGLIAGSAHVACVWSRSAK